MNKDDGIISDAVDQPRTDQTIRSKGQSRRLINYVSRHFVDEAMRQEADNGKRKRRRTRFDKNDAIGTHNAEGPQGRLQSVPHRKNGMSQRERIPSQDLDEHLSALVVSPEDTATPDLLCRRHATTANESEQSMLREMLGTIGLEELSSDSTLTDAPDDLSDPFESDTPAKSSRWSQESKIIAVKSLKAQKPSRKSTLTKSPYFPHPHKHRSTFLSTLPFPPLDQETFGLMQERLCREPFRLLIATIFLNKTPGSRAMPIFYKLMEQYPTPETLAKAEQVDVTNTIRQLGFQNQRARKIIALAQKWTESPARKGRRFRKLGYPFKGDGKDIKAEEIIDDEDPRVAFEISHLPGVGEYSHDSWRMFCRDMMRGVAHGYNGEGAAADGAPFEPEWKRVIPKDKELRAWITWMWMKEGYVYNKETGERTKASEELMALARDKDNVVLENESNTLHVKSLRQDMPSPQKLNQPSGKVQVGVPAGGFLPSLMADKDIKL